MAVETVKTGQLIAIADVLVHEYQIDAATYKALKSDYGAGIRTIRCTVKSGTVKFGINEDPGASNYPYVVGESFVGDIVNGVSNLRALGSNPSSFVYEL